MTRKAYGLILATVWSEKPSLAFINERIFSQKIYTVFPIRTKLSTSNDSDLDNATVFDDELPGLSTSTWKAEDDWSALSAADATAPLTTPDYAFASNLDVISDAQHILAEQNSFVEDVNRYNDEWESLSTICSTDYDGTSLKDHTDQFVDDAVETILNHMDNDENIALYDTKSSNHLNEYGQDQDDNEMVYMIRCNQSPKQFLVSQGKVLPELSDNEKYSSTFLFEKKLNEIKMSLEPNMTSFFKNAVETIFSKYSTEDEIDEPVMDRNALALWMTTCMSYNPNSSAPHKIIIGQHDTNISKYLSRYCLDNGSGRLTFEEFSLLYLESAWVGYLNDVRKSRGTVLMVDGKLHSLPSWAESTIVNDRRNTDFFLKDASLRIIWRDLEAHGQVVFMVICC